MNDQGTAGFGHWFYLPGVLVWVPSELHEALSLCRSVGFQGHFADDELEEMERCEDGEKDREGAAVVPQSAGMFCPLAQVPQTSSPVSQ